MNYLDPAHDDSQPAKSSELGSDSQNAADLIRQKVARIYDEEPSAKEEMAEAKAASGRSKHQQFMYELSTSGKDLATIQTEWHNYYQALPAKEKHQVWHEFYASQANVTQSAPVATAAPLTQTPQAAQVLAKHKQQATSHRRKKSATKKIRDARSTSEVQAAIRDKVSAGGQLTAKHHIQSLLFGLGMGAIVIIIFLFSFFNEIIIAPFIQPGRVAADTPLIVTDNSIAATAQPEVIIPKINVEIPVDYSQTTTDENQIENALESGVVHYPTTVKPGEKGNAAFFGHSSNNIFNKGKYKFAFVLLHTLQNGDTFYLTYNSKAYAYKVISKTIVDPSDVGVLGPVAGQAATATLITCDPPGTSLHRLVVVGQQISPDPSGNAAASAPAVSTTASALPGNGPTLWHRFISSAGGKTVAIVVVLGVGAYGLRRANKALHG